MIRRLSRRFVETLEHRRHLAATLQVLGGPQQLNVAAGDFRPNRIDFTDQGPVPLSGVITTGARTFTVKNIGRWRLNFTDTRIQITGQDAAQFSILARPPGRLNAGQSGTFRIGFDPTSAGVKNARVSLLSNDTNRPVFSFGIRGNGVNPVNLPGGLQYFTTITGDATKPAAANGTLLQMHYIGLLQNGNQFDSSLSRNQPFAFTLGANEVIDGWDEGLVGARVGEERFLFIPADKGYGAQGSGTSIPPNSPLIFSTTVLTYGPAISVTGRGNFVIGDGDFRTNTLDGSDFGSRARNTESAATTFTISASILSNRTGPELTGTPQVQLRGANPGDFIVSQPVFADGNATFTIRFRPTALGLRSAEVSIRNNNPFDNDYNFLIRGTGT